VKFTDDGEVLVTVGGTQLAATRRGGAARWEIRVDVRDTGIGIEPEDIDKVFHIFRRGCSAAVQKVAGKGVGLSSVKSIVEMYSGSIWVESKFGEGSTFFFTINGKYVGEGSDAAAELAQQQLKAA